MEGGKLLGITRRGRWKGERKWERRTDERESERSIRGDKINVR
jgi:hypothetical protein